MSLVTGGLDEQLACLLTPIDPETPAGLFDMEDETYQAIDQEMVKLGGLQEASIDWAYIEEASCQYLGQHCKHLRIVAHLSAAWLRSRCWARWGMTLALLSGMVEGYWETAHPNPGPKGLLGKRKLVALTLNRLIEALPHLDRFTYSPACTAAAQGALTRLEQQLGQARLEGAALGELTRLLSKYSSMASGIGEAPEPAASIQTAPLADVSTRPAPCLAIGNERETRGTVLSMAELINQQDPYDPTGYQLRRFGLWSHIQAAPAAKQRNCTGLLALPADVVAGYESAAAGASHDIALLHRLEKSITAAPYWMRGSYLAAGVASQLAMPEVSEAIRSTTARFVQRLPSLQQLCFSDGTAFVDDQCLAWLRGNRPTAEQGAAFQAFRGLREDLSAELEGMGVEQALLKLQGMQAGLHSPRERSRTTLIAADLLAGQGVSWLAQDLCAAIARTMQRTTADAWEPELFQRLQHYTISTALADQNKDADPR
ncbi:MULTISPECIES: type VI secretion system protein TssA [unclassified Pseudomonas]|uniref:type VI secretion system protein TssA n=1 Tax=unclassified Pseudomonas TaxID=196821 RepID=UPI00224B874A|nr:MULTISPECIES: type VI secretion system protein TssA [unclassified Pseudomonas]MCX2890171.1 type VI secretion system protein TssA [Pseudomonas sp. DCB_BI]MDH4552151.1 type VI secretion system protein TssA [Pseudomonas sp. BN607]